MKKLILIFFSTFLLYSCKKSTDAEKTVKAIEVKSDTLSFDILELYNWSSDVNITVYNSNKTFKGIYFKSDTELELTNEVYTPRGPQDGRPIDYLNKETDPAKFTYKIASSKNLSKDEIASFKTNDIIIYQKLSTVHSTVKQVLLDRNPSYRDNTNVAFLVMKYDSETKTLKSYTQYGLGNSTYLIRKQ